MKKNVISLAEKRYEYNYRTLQDLALVELFHRNRGYFPESGPEFKIWIDKLLPSLGYKLPIDPAEVFDREQLSGLRNAIEHPTESMRPS